MLTNIEPGLAFFEGLALIVSPCILPVLPLVLSASVDGGRRRPFGIITGFVLAFSIFTLASRKLIQVLGVDAQIIQNGSLVLLALFAIILLSSTLSAKFSDLTRQAAYLGNRFSTNDNSGYGSGVIIGALIGLIWTPCAGPILAAVLVQIIRQQTDLQSLIIIVPFAIGAGIPMMIIALMGRKVMSRLGFFTRHSESVRKGFGAIILLTVGYSAFGNKAAALFNSTEKLVTVQASSGLQDGLKQPYPTPQLVDIQEWINSGPLELVKLKGKVVLIDFWTYSCINCVRTLPYMTAWDQKYRDQGLVIIGISAPEFEFEKNADNVKAAVEEHHIKYPVALDNNLSTWSNFNNRYWPGHYLIDRNGQVVYTHFGEGNYDITENNIRVLLGLNNDIEDTTKIASLINRQQTPETYLGYARAERYVGDQALVSLINHDYHFPENIALNSWALNGKWTVNQDKIISKDQSASLRFNFDAQKVFLVLGTTGDQTIEVTVRLNGQIVSDGAGKDVKQGKLKVDRHTLYELIDQQSAQSGLLEIQSSAPGLEAYAFTFGN